MTRSTFSWAAARSSTCPVARSYRARRGYGYSGYLAEPGKPCLQLTATTPWPTAPHVRAQGWAMPNRTFKVGRGPTISPSRRCGCTASGHWQKGGVNQNVTQLSYDFAATRRITRPFARRTACPGEDLGHARLGMWLERPVSSRMPAFLKLREASISVDVAADDGTQVLERRAVSALQP